MSVRVVTAALDEMPNGSIILRGVLDAASLKDLQVAPYQREILPVSTINELVAAFKSGSPIPDIELGCRGSNFNERNGTWEFDDDIYIIDGLQRVTAGMGLVQEGEQPHLGAIIHFNTTEAWERERFRILNSERTKLSSNILLRNMRHDLPVVDMLYKLTFDPKFVMHNRISWAQHMKREELITAMTYAQAVGFLHSHLASTRYKNYGQLSQGLETLMRSVGRGVLRDNIKTFFLLIDECWGIRRIAYKEKAAYMRSGFLIALAEVLSNHLDFWDGNRLVVRSDLKKKLLQFPVTDPTVIQLASATGKSRQMLVMLLIDHINRGKSTRRLKSRVAIEVDPESEALLAEINGEEPTDDHGEEDFTEAAD